MREISATLGQYAHTEDRGRSQEAGFLRRGGQLDVAGRETERDRQRREEQNAADDTEERDGEKEKTAEGE